TPLTSLLSFPTRRSSDLSMNSIDLLVWAAAVWLMIRILQSSNTINTVRTEHTEHTEDRDRHRDSPNADRLWIALGILFGVGLERSEEHTSELQSRVDLVC